MGKKDNSLADKIINTFNGTKPSTTKTSQPGLVEKIVPVPGIKTISEVTRNAKKKSTSKATAKKATKKIVVRPPARKKK